MGKSQALCPLFTHPFEEITNMAFNRGEKLTYIVYYKTFLTGKIKAEEITIEVKNDKRKFNGRSNSHIEANGVSRHSLKWLIEVEVKLIQSQGLANPLISKVPKAFILT